MPGPTTEVLSDDLKAVTTELHRIEVRSARSFGEVRTDIGKLAAELGLIKWLVGASLLASISGIAGSSYWAGSLASQVGAVETRADKTDARLDRIESSIGTINGRLERIEDSVGAMDSRLGRIEASITKAIGRADGAGASSPEKR